MAASTGGLEGTRPGCSEFTKQTQKTQIDAPNHKNKQKQMKINQNQKLKAKTKKPKINKQKTLKPLLSS